MRFRHPAAAASILLCLVSCTVFHTSASAAEPSLGLDWVVRRALEANLDLRVQTFVPALSETDVRRESALYDPRLGALLDHRRERSPVGPSSDSSDLNRTYDANFFVDRLLPTGATLSGSFTNFWSRSTASSTLDSIQQPGLTLSFSQPLLGGRGREATERNLTAARNIRDASVAAWHAAALSTAGGARDQYFALVKIRQNLETRQAALAAAERLHEENRARVGAGVLASVELLDSELGVSQRQIDLLEAERQVQDQSDVFRVYLQLPASAQVVPGSSWPGEEEGRGEERLIAAALERRSELRQARISLRTLEMDERVAQNALLPSLSAVGSAGLQGVGEDYGEAAGDVASWKFPVWSVGLNLSYPLGNAAAEANLSASRLRLRQAKARLHSLEQAVALEVRSALRSLATRLRQIEVAEKGVALAESRLASFQKRQRLGLATTKDVLEAVADLTAAREILTGTRADRESALTQLWKSTGELLDRHGIHIDDADIAGMAWKESP